MFKLIIKQNVQIQKMEADMESLLKEKEQQLSISVAIPIATNSVAGTSVERTYTTTIVVEMQSIDSTKQLSKAMGDLSLKDQEIKKLKMQLQKVQEQKIKSDNAYLAEIQKNYKLTQQLQVYEN